MWSPKRSINSFVDEKSTLVVWKTGTLNSRQGVQWNSKKRYKRVIKGNWNHRYQTAAAEFPIRVNGTSDSGKNNPKKNTPVKMNLKIKENPKTPNSPTKSIRKKSYEIVNLKTPKKFQQFLKSSHAFYGTPNYFEIKKHGYEWPPPPIK